MTRHFLELSDQSPATLQAILDRAEAARGQVLGHARPGGAVALIFEKPSTRTRLSFEVAVSRLGARPMVLTPQEMQLGRGETVEDTAAVLGRYCDAVMLRATAHETLTRLAAASPIPVINGLTPNSHPCQLMADLLTLQRRFGALAGRRIAWLGDGNNVAASWIQAAAAFGFTLAIAGPAAYQPGAGELARARAAGAVLDVTEDPYAAAAGADAVVTDTWLSLNDPAEQRAARLEALAPYRVTEAVMAAARPDAVFLHCLPAHRGEEVTAEVIDGAQSLVLAEAENRLHAQLGILLWCLGLDATGAPAPE